jgi:serine protease Do
VISAASGRGWLFEAAKSETNVRKDTTMNSFSNTDNESLQAPLGPSAGGVESSEPAPWVWANPDLQSGVQMQAPVDPGGPGRRGLIRRILSPLVIVAAVSGLVASGTTFAVTTAVNGSSTAAVSGAVAGAAVLNSASLSLADIVARAEASVVTINVTETATSRGQTVSGVGSGIIVGANGLILTNDHVVTGAATIEVTLPNGQTEAGTVAGVSNTTDLAIVKVAATGLTAATLGNSGALQVGESVVAVGDPLGQFTDSATAGIVSGLNRTITVETETLTGLVQTDASVNPGNSGGPLIDASGNVIAVVTASSSSAQGISFAIPISAASSMIAAALAGQPIA